MQGKKIKVTFLGTGTSTGVPVIACNCPVCKSNDPRDKRFRTSVLVNICERNIIIDCGPDFRFQMLKNKVEDIDAVIFTHQHRDHIAGLDDIRAFNYILNKSIDIYGSALVIDAIKTEFPYIFKENSFFAAPQLNVNIIDEQPFKICDIEIIPIRVMHGKMEIFGFRIGDFSYITDANFIEPSELDKIRGSKVVVLNALRNSKHVSHYCLSESVEILNDLKPQSAYLTHISHFLGLHIEVESKLPSFIKPAYDNLVIEI